MRRRRRGESGELDDVRRNESPTGLGRVGLPLPPAAEKAGAEAGSVTRRRRAGFLRTHVGLPGRTDGGRTLAPVSWLHGVSFRGVGSSEAARSAV